MRISYIAPTLLALSAFGVPAFADVIVTSTFNVSGTSASDGRVQDGQAVFTIDETTKTITVQLKNTDPATIGGISQTLVGVTWSFDNGNTPGTLSLNSSATAAGLEDCTSGTCVLSAAPTGTDFGWSLNAGSGPGGVGVTTPNLFAGGGSGKPDGIVTTNIDGSSSGINNGPHNPYLVGPVVFTLTYTGNVTSIDAATIYFGTGGESQTGRCTDCTLSTGGGQVPEPSSVVLLGSLLLGAGGVFRKKFQHKV